MIDYDETFVLVAWLEAIGIFPDFVVYKKFWVFQMDIKSAFINGLLQEVIYLKQSPGFVYHSLLIHVFKLHTTLYGLKQAPRALYDILSQFVINHDLTIETLDKNSFTFLKNQHWLLVQIYIDDILYQLTSICVRNFLRRCGNNLKRTWWKN